MLCSYIQTTASGGGGKTKAVCNKDKTSLTENVARNTRGTTSCIQRNLSRLPNVWRIFNLETGWRGIY